MSMIKELYEEGIEIGTEKGIKIGTEKGIEIGIKKEREEAKARNEARIEEKTKAKTKAIARAMLRDNIDIRIISKYTGLSRREVEKLKLGLAAF